MISEMLIRQRLHSYHEVADTKMVEAIYTMVAGQIEEEPTIYTTAFKKELDDWKAAHEADKTTAITAEESEEQVARLLQSYKK